MHVSPGPTHGRCLTPVRVRVRVRVCVCVCDFSHVRLFATPWTITHQAPLFMGFSRQEYWIELPCPPPGDLPDPGIEPMSLASPALAGGFFTTSANWEVRSNNGGGGLVAKLCPTLCVPDGL